MLERFEAMLITAGYEVLSSAADGEMMRYELQPPDGTQALQFALRKTFLEDNPEDGIDIVKKMFERAQY